MGEASSLVAEIQAQADEETKACLRRVGLGVLRVGGTLGVLRPDGADVRPAMALRQAETTSGHRFSKDYYRRQIRGGGWWNVVGRVGDDHERVPV